MIARGFTVLLPQVVSALDAGRRGLRVGVSACEQVQEVFHRSRRVVLFLLEQVLCM